MPKQLPESDESEQERNCQKVFGRLGKLDELEKRVHDPGIFLTIAATALVSSEAVVSK